MSKKEKSSDECVLQGDVQRIHSAMVKSGATGPLTDLAEREAALGAYVMFSGHMVSEAVRVSGAPSAVVALVKESVMTHALVCIEAQRQALYNLWGEFLGEFPMRDSSEKPHEGDDHE